MTYRLQDLIDMDQFQDLQDRLNEIYSFPAAIIDNDGHVLTATAWQDICTQFHRKNKDSETICIQSDQYILDHLHEANPAVTYQCPHGLVDNAMPIIIEGVHYGNFFTGQFFLKKPDLAFFKAQALKYGFDEKAYLEAVKKVPIWTRTQLSSYLGFIQGLIRIISESGLKKLKEREIRRQIQKSNDYHRSILQTTMDGFWQTDMDGRLMEVNDSYCRMSGYTRKELLKMRIQDLEAVESAKTIRNHLRTVAEKGSERFETRHRRKDGSVCDVEVSVQFQPEEGGRCICFFRDITDRLQRDKDIQTLLETTVGKSGQELFDVAVAGLCEWLDCECALIGEIKPDKRVAAISMILDTKRVEEYSYPLKGTPCAEAVEGHFCIYPENVCSLFPEDNDLKKLKAEGYVGISLKGNQGETAGVFCGISRGRMAIRKNTTAIMSIVGARISAEMIRIQSEKEKQHLEIQIQQARKMESIGRLAGGVAHDFNNMLGVILGNTAMIMEDMEPAHPFAGNLKEIHRAADRSAHLTKQLLGFARKQTFSPGILNLNDTVGAMLSMLKRIIGENIDLVWQPLDTIRPVFMDPAQVDQILVNLCVNARDAVKGTGKVLIETGSAVFDPADCRMNPDVMPGEFTRLTLSDTGCGMDTTTLNHLFEPFFTTKENGQGTGLGLATVYGIVKQNNGFIRVFSKPDQGTAFHLYFPCCYEASIPEEETEPQMVIAKGNQTILLVEDEIAVLHIVKTILERLGYTVMTAQGPGEALNLIETADTRIHLLITDLIMPEMSGKDLAGILSEKYPDLKCLLMSGYSADIISNHGVLGKGIHFIQKPFSKQDLSVKIRDILDQ